MKFLDDFVVKENEKIELTKVDGDLEVKDGAVINIPAEVEYLVVNGDLNCDGDIVIKGSISANNVFHRDGDLEITGNVKTKELTVKSRASRNGPLLIIGGSLECEEASIDGSLEVGEDLSANDVEIMGSCSVTGISKINEYEVNGSAKHGGDIYADEVEVNGSLKAESNVIIEEEMEIGGSANILGDLKCPKTEVGGSLSVKGTTECKQIETGGSFRGERIAAEEVSIGGSGRFTSADISRELTVNGSVKCEGALRVPKLEINGSCRVGDDSNISECEVNGSMSMGHNLNFETLNVSGSMSCGNDGTGDTINVNGSFKSQGLLKVASEISVDGSVTGDKIETGTMKVNGSLRCEETKADLIILGKHSRARGTLIAKKVILKKGAKAETVIADEVELGSRARVTNLQAKIVNEEEYTDTESEEY